MMVDEEVYLTGHCGSFALALYELLEGKVELGMLIGERTNEWEEEEIVNIHCFVFMPGNYNLGIDVTGVFAIRDWEDRWLMNEKMYNDHGVRAQTEIAILPKADFLEMLALTKSPEPSPDVLSAAKEYILEHKTLDLLS